MNLEVKAALEYFEYLERSGPGSYSYEPLLLIGALIEPHLPQLSHSELGRTAEVMALVTKQLRESEESPEWATVLAERVVDSLIDETMRRTGEKPPDEISESSVREILLRGGNDPEDVEKFLREHGYEKS